MDQEGASKGARGRMRGCSPKGLFRLANESDMHQRRGQVPVEHGVTGQDVDLDVVEAGPKGSKGM